jgi:hypothetical protein
LTALRASSDNNNNNNNTTAKTEVLHREEKPTEVK